MRLDSLPRCHRCRDSQTPTHRSATSWISAGTALLDAASCLVARRHDAGPFDHQDDTALRGAGAMHDAFGHDEALLRGQRHCPAFQIDQKLAFYDVKELIEVVVFVPVVLAFHDAEPDNRI